MEAVEAEVDRLQVEESVNFVPPLGGGGRNVSKELRRNEEVEEVTKGICEIQKHLARNLDFKRKSRTVKYLLKTGRFGLKRCGVP